MKRFSPNATLAVLLSAAIVLLLAGIGFARREQHTRGGRDREPVRQFAGELQKELRRLERLYEAHLTRLARSAPLDDTQAIWRSCDRVTGIRQFSLVQSAVTTGADLHLAIEQPHGSAWPLPAVVETSEGMPRTRVLLSKAELFDGPEESGWIDEPGKPLMFWFRRTNNACVVLLIDDKAVASAMDTWLRSWVDATFEPVRVAGGPDELRSPSGSTIAGIGTTSEAAADLLLPLRTRFGAWELASWDRYTTHVTYRMPVLAGSVAVSVLVALLGITTSIQQRRTLRLAEERVSFVNAVSHELRAPLTNILLNIELVSEATAEQPEVARRLGLVEEEARRLTRLVDNALTFAEHDRKSRECTPRACVPASVVRSVLGQFAPSLTRRGFTVHCSGNAEEARLLDADGLAQILGNLISNVEKYVPGGAVNIESHLSEDVLTIVVSDDGPGIPPGESERIFLPFERLDTRLNNAASGTGLGLSIARSLATRMGGSLRLLPSEKGAAFELRILAPSLPDLRAANVA